MIIAILVTAYLMLIYFIGFKWFGNGEHWANYILLFLSPIVVPIYLVLMLLFMGLASDD